MALRTHVSKLTIHILIESEMLNRIKWQVYFHKYTLSKAHDSGLQGDEHPWWMRFCRHHGITYAQAEIQQHITSLITFNTQNIQTWEKCTRSYLYLYTMDGVVAVVRPLPHHSPPFLPKTHKRSPNEKGHTCQRVLPKTNMWQKKEENIRWVWWRKLGTCGKHGAHVATWHEQQDKLRQFNWK